MLIGVFCILVSLGFWQLQRADEKKRILDAFQLAQNAQVLTVEAHHLGALSQHLYQNVRLVGRYEHAYQLIYDNQTEQGTSGYHVLTPFIIEGAEKAVLVNRGFIAWGNRRRVAEVSVDNQAREIVVQLAPIHKRFKLDDHLTDGFPLLIQSLDLASIRDKTGLSFVPVMARLAPDEADGYIRNWQPFYGNADKHTAYAMQWFLMAVMLCVLSFFFWRRKIKSSS